MVGQFSPLLVQYMKEALEQKEQVILFQNKSRLCSHDRMPYLRLGAEVQKL